MRNILCVKPDDRDWLRLGHYEGLNFDNLPAKAPGKDANGSAGGGDDDSMDVDTPDRPTVESVNRLRRRLQASQKLNTMLHAEKARNDALLGELRSLVGRVGAGAGGGAVKDEPQSEGGGTKPKPPLAFLRDRGDLTLADAKTPLTTTTAFSLSQLQALRALSGSLSSILPSLQGGGGDEGGGGGRRTWRKERVEYVEGAARKHLEHVRGLELGSDGEVRDGEWQGEGRRFAGGEVAALEGVVNALAGSGDKGGDEKMDEE